MSSHPRRWFMYSLSGLFIFLCLAIILAAILLLRRGKLPRAGLIAGSSMEPILRGPRFLWTCPHCSQSQEFALDTCKSNQPFRCRSCNIIDMASASDFDDSDSLFDRVRPGDQVLFATLRSVRTTRSRDIALELARPSGLRRGDVVVFQESLDSKREIKRVVGFASELIAIESGDLFVDQERWCKTMEQSLRQSILLNAWDRTSPDNDKEQSIDSKGRWVLGAETFNGILSSSSVRADTPDTPEIPRKLLFDRHLDGAINNKLGVNAHDSHVVFSVPDFGFAFQLSLPENAWRIECALRSPISRPKIAIELVGRSVTIESGDHVAYAELYQREDKSVWIAIAMVDGHLIAGSPEQEWLRMVLPAMDADSAKDVDEAKPPIEITAVSGSLAIDQMLVFRDIHYRGAGDSETQSWEPGDRIVVLGDNVSASSDSRDRWPDGLPTNSARGVLIQTGSPIEVLLRQR